MANNPNIKDPDEQRAVGSESIGRHGTAKDRKRKRNRERAERKRQEAIVEADDHNVTLPINNDI